MMAGGVPASAQAGGGSVPHFSSPLVLTSGGPWHLPLPRVFSIREGSSRCPPPRHLGRPPAWWGLQGPGAGRVGTEVSTLPSSSPGPPPGSCRCPLGARGPGASAGGGGLQKVALCSFPVALASARACAVEGRER